MLNDKIIQIMPAPKGLLGVYTDDTDGKEFYTPVVCLALTEEGDVLMMDTDDYGEIAPLAGNKGIKWVGVNADINSITDDINPQSKVKESKEK